MLNQRLRSELCRPTEKTRCSAREYLDTLPPTNVQIVPSQATGTAGQSALLSISVTGSDPAASCGGSGYLIVDQGYAGAFFPDANGNVSMSTPVLGVGTHTILAQYHGTTVCRPAAPAISYQVQ